MIKKFQHFLRQHKQSKREYKIQLRLNKWGRWRKTKELNRITGKVFDRNYMKLKIILFSIHRKMFVFHLNWA